LSESEVKKCPKCGGEMEEGFLPGAPHWKPGRGIFGLRGYRISVIGVKTAVLSSFMLKNDQADAHGEAFKA